MVPTRGQQLPHGAQSAGARHPAHVDVITGPGDFHAQGKRLLGAFLANDTIERGKISSGVERETLWIATPTELFQGHFRGGRLVLHADSSSTAWQVPDTPTPLY